MRTKPYTPLRKALARQDNEPDVFETMGKFLAALKELEAVTKNADADNVDRARIDQLCAEMEDICREGVRAWHYERYKWIRRWRT